MDLLYYVYCIMLGRSEEEFFSSSIAKIAKMVDMHADRLNLERAKAEGEFYESKYFAEKEKVVYSMRDIV